MCRKNSPPDGSSLVSKKCSGRTLHKSLSRCGERLKIKISKLLEEYAWTSVLSIQSIQEKAKNFQSALMQMYNDCFQDRANVIKAPPFLTPLVKHLLKRRRALLRKKAQEQTSNVTLLQERISKLIRENQLQAVKH